MMDKEKYDRYAADDTFYIPKEIMEMSSDERQKIIKEYEEELKREQSKEKNIA